MLALPGSERHDDLRRSDVLTFLALFDKCEDAMVESYNQLFALIGLPVTTTIGRLQRIIEFLFANRKDLKPSANGPGFEVLFHPTEARGLQPTPVAREIYRYFRNLNELCDTTRIKFQQKLEKKVNDRRPVVSLGMPQTLAYRLCACAFSTWRDIFGHELELRIEIDNSVELVRRMSAGGMLDGVIAYGRASRKSVAKTSPSVEKCEQIDNELDVCFRSLEYCSRMALLVHPSSCLPAKARRAADEPSKDYNENYWIEMQRIQKAHRDQLDNPRTPSKRRPSKSARSDSIYDQLRQVDPSNIDFSDIPLIVVASYNQPKAIQSLLDNLRMKTVVREAHSYEEALALVRAGQGVAFATEAFCTRNHITAFKLEPNEEYERDIGVYFSQRNGLDEKTNRLIYFLKDYLHTFEAKIRAGASPAFGDDFFLQWCKKYREGNTQLPAAWHSDHSQTK